ncbi:right-handed parallel beta-helix repeat-containing protein [Catenulispora acidiphila]|uniref:right-handed parallel beta-helix repeat-containing protein n=1 Tax=Catenulispora acidiphila TaxID=304895 RepID=UPI00019E3E0E|nr:right-handed parallel beta-helix repeat-containing protein [Catenulispora acidiphila]
MTLRRRARTTTAWFAVAAAIAGLVVFVGRHDAYPKTQVPLESGQAWVDSQQIGKLTLLDGIAAQPVTNVPVARHLGDPFAAGQVGGTGYAVDQLTGQVTRIDGSSLKGKSVVQSLGGGDNPSLVRLYTALDTLYVVDGTDGMVSTYDASSLRQLGSPERFAAAGAEYTALVDGQGKLWVLDGVSGTLTWFTATEHGTRTPGFTAGAAVLTLADERPVVVDSSTHEAYLLSSSGATKATLSLGTADSTGLQATGAAGETALLVTASSQGTYQTCTFTKGCGPGQCITSGGGTPGRCVGAGLDTLGTAVAADGRVFVPDYSTGGVWIVDPSAAAKPFEVPLLALRGPFELFDTEGVLFFNDPNSSRAGTLAPDGTVQDIVKYTQAPPPSSAPPPTDDIRPSTSPPTTSASTATPARSASHSVSASRTQPSTASATSTTPPKRIPTTHASSRSPGPGPSPSTVPSPSPSPTRSTGTPANISCGETVTKSVVVEADLRCAGDALTISAKGVTIDLAGHTLSGSGKGAGITLAGSGSVAGALIENGTITGFGSGVKVGPNGATSPTLYRVVFTHDGAGGGAAVSLGVTTVQGLTLSDVKVEQSDGAGLDTHGALAGSLQITGSAFDGAAVNIDEASDGIQVQATITDDRFDDSALSLEFVGSTTVSTSVFTDSPVVDMCNAAGGDLFSADTFTGSDTGLKIQGMAYESVTGSHFTGNNIGMFYDLQQGDVGNSVSGNTFADEGSAAILVQDSSPVAQEVDVKDNIVTDSGHRPGPKVADPGGNQVLGGIHIYTAADTVTVSGNKTSHDAGSGIWARPGSAAGEGNVSTGDADKCSPVDLCAYG